MPTTDWITKNLVSALLAGVWTERSLLYRAEKFLGAKSKLAQRKLISALWKYAPGPVPPSPDWLVSFLACSPAIKAASAALRKQRTGVRAILAPPQFAPSERFKSLVVPRLATVGELAAWLGVTLQELDWLFDRWQQQGRTATPALQHYTCHFLPKRSGSPRLIEHPKSRLKAIQRRILHDILDAVPPHPAAHGFVAGRSCVTGAAVHAGEAVVLTADLKDFFLRTRVSRVHALFHNLGYPDQTARALTGFVTTSTPDQVFMALPDWRRHGWETRKTYASPHLPQGAPTSPALANLAAWSLDTRVTGLARSFGVVYTRYADDLAFSSDARFEGRAPRFLTLLAEIAADEGYALNPAKTRLMTQATAQRVTGIVINEKVNISRTSYDWLKATLNNCVRLGPEGQNREGLPDFQAHLAGRIAWVAHVNPVRGQKLTRLYERIDWPS